MRAIIAAIFLGLICVSGVGMAGEKTGPKLIVTKTITELMKAHQIPGAAVAVNDHGKSRIYVFGVANKSTNIKVTDETIFELGSITKLFTALLFVATANTQRGLEESITKFAMADYYYRWYRNQYLRQITVEKLLTYTSGLPFKLPENITTQAGVHNYLATWQPKNLIGIQWQYSNVGIGLVGSALENMEGVGIDKLYKKYLLKPLKMLPIGIEVDEKFQRFFAQGYTEPGEVAEHSRVGLFPAAGDMKANIQDMAHFLALAVGASKNAPSNLKRGMQEMQTPRLAVGNALQGLVWQIHSLDDRLLLREPDEMNLGPIPVKWLPEKQRVFEANKLIDKTGATEGFRAYIAVIPAQQKGIVILLNKYISNGAIVNAGRKIILESGW